MVERLPPEKDWGVFLHRMIGVLLFLPSRSIPLWAIRKLHGSRPALFCNERGQLFGTGLTLPATIFFSIEATRWMG